MKLQLRVPLSTQRAFRNWRSTATSVPGNRSLICWTLTPQVIAHAATWPAGSAAQAQLVARSGYQLTIIRDKSWSALHKKPIVVDFINDIRSLFDDLRKHLGVDQCYG